MVDIKKMLGVQVGSKGKQLIKPLSQHSGFSFDEKVFAPQKVRRIKPQPRPQPIFNFQQPVMRVQQPFFTPISLQQQDFWRALLIQQRNELLRAEYYRQYNEKNRQRTMAQEAFADDDKDGTPNYADRDPENKQVE